MRLAAYTQKFTIQTSRNLEYSMFLKEIIISLEIYVKEKK